MPSNEGEFVRRIVKIEKWLRRLESLVIRPAGSGNLHDAVTVTDTATINLTLTGQNIQADYIGGSGHTIKDEAGAGLTARTNLNFTGAGVTATDNAGTDSTDVTIPGGAGTFVGASYKTDAAQTIVNNAADAIINFEDVVYDTGSLVTTGASWKFTAPTTGYYHIDVLVTFAGNTGWAVPERGVIYLYVDGVSIVMLDRKDNFAGGGNILFMTLQGSITIALTATQYLDIRIAQNSGGNINLNSSSALNHINIEKVG